MEWLLGALGGALVGLVVGAVVKPLNDWLVSVSEEIWGVRAVKVHVERDQRLIWANTPPWLSFSYAFESGLPSEAPPDDPFDWWEWADRNGGVDLGLAMLQVTIQARAAASVVIEDVLVRSKRRDRPTLAGALFPAAGGADLNPRRLDVDLDAWDPPIVEFRLSPSSQPGPAPALFLGAGDVERFHIWVRASRGWNEWYLELPLLVDGRRQVERIGSPEKPMTIVGWELPKAIYEPAPGGGWVNTGPAPAQS